MAHKKKNGQRKDKWKPICAEEYSARNQSHTFSLQQIESKLAKTQAKPNTALVFSGFVGSSLFLLGFCGLLAFSFSLERVSETYGVAVGGLIFWAAAQAFILYTVRNIPFETTAPALKTEDFFSFLLDVVLWSNSWILTLATPRQKIPKLAAPILLLLANDTKSLELQQGLEDSGHGVCRSEFLRGIKFLLKNRWITGDYQKGYSLYKNRLL